MDDRSAFIAKIVENPADDVARLVFADWMEENGEPKRAEFIRVQVSISNHPAKCAYGNPSWGPSTIHEKGTCRWCDLKHRQEELTGIGRPGEYRPKIWEWFIRDFPCGEVEVSRGFVSTVRCRLADWVGGACPCVNGHDYDSNGERTLPWCPKCNGTGRTPAHGPRIVAKQPVEGVVSDREPYEYSDGNWVDNYPEEKFMWVEANEDRPDLWSLNRDIFKLLDGFSGEYRRNESSGRFGSSSGSRPRKLYPTEAAAQSALSLALVNWARLEAGLPPLSDMV